MQWIKQKALLKSQESRNKSGGGWLRKHQCVDEKPSFASLN
jgi:hypothetical protein